MSLLEGQKAKALHTHIHTDGRTHALLESLRLDEKSVSYLYVLRAYEILSHLMLSLMSSYVSLLPSRTTVMLTNGVNFVIYFIFGRSFRESFYALVVPRFIRQKLREDLPLQTFFTGTSNVGQSHNAPPVDRAKTKGGDNDVDCSGKDSGIGA